ncbi:SIMPL domain-containing protein [Glaciibacter psychrotolerans]|uniref:SIMPL domain-containing protein n=1 Tax=Glaciibacter psychrotolerans TaxID=670054 RepID=A0A7Z0EB18_9MICO|nr:SIMPL domain-containing protein [Leifsonia psychrotolerans]NYJ18294.1 hypothetical protein [Leifsonia psychrotolerans]
MQETVITVQGRHTAWHPPERATAAVTVAFEGPRRQLVVSDTTRVADAVRTTIVDRHDSPAGPVTRWSSDAVNVWSTVPWNNEGIQLPPVFHAAIGFSVRFKDFAVLTQWIEEIADRDGVSVGNIEWSLTEARKAAMTATVQALAVNNATTKASVYAKSIGLGSVRAIALADPGMLGDNSGGVSAGGVHDGIFVRALAVSGESELSLKPQELEISAAIDARFVAV